MAELESSGSIPLAGVAVALLLLGTMGLGGIALRPSSTKHWHFVDSLIVRLAVGVGLLGVAGLLLGWSGGLANGRSVWLLLGLSCLGLRPGLWLNRSGESSVAHTMRLRQWLSLPGLGAIFVAAITLGPALSYPTGWDELVYHSVLPGRWLLDGGPAVYPDIPYSGFPSLGEILFWLMAPIERVIAPRLLIWVCWILGLLGVYRLLRRRLAAPYATILTLAFILNDTLLLVSANCYVESIMLWQVAALFLAVSLPGWRGATRQSWEQAAVLGILAGSGAAVKLTGGVLLALPGIWYAGHLAMSPARWRLATARGAFSLVVACCVCFPFYLRPWIATGNPFYPYLDGWFTADPARIEMSRHHHLLGGSAFGIKSPAALLDTPMLLAFRAENYDGEFGWQLLGLLALAIAAVVSLGRRRLRLIVAWPLAVAFWFYAFWFFTAQQARFAIPFVLAILLLAGLGLRTLPRRGRRLALIALVAATLFSAPWRRTDYYLASWLTVFGQLSRTDYVHNLTELRYLPWIQACHILTGPDAKIMLLYEHRGFYLSRDYLIGTPLFQAGPFTPPERFADVESVMAVLQQHQITHVVASKTNLGPDHAPGWGERQHPFLQALEKCVEQRGLLLRWESGEHVLWEVVQ